MGNHYFQLEKCKLQYLEMFFVVIQVLVYLEK